MSVTVAMNPPLPSPTKNYIIIGKPKFYREGLHGFGAQSMTAVENFKGMQTRGSDFNHERLTYDGVGETQM